MVNASAGLLMLGPRSPPTSRHPQMLRKLANPICLFGEGPGERRDRLRELMATLGDQGLLQKHDHSDDEGGAAEVQTDTHIDRLRPY